jgi:protein gp37
VNWTQIQWVWAMGPDGNLIPNSGSTWNPILGCKEVSPGCANCYSARLIGTRMSKNPSLPLYHDLAVVGSNGHPHFTGAHRSVPDRLDEPLRSRKGRRIFVNDMGDLFYEQHPDSEIAAVFSVMERARHQTFLVLTKRPERMANFCLDYFRATSPSGETTAQIPENIWFGTSVENQDVADKRIPHLMRLAGAMVLFLSCEPLLGPVVLPAEFLALGRRGWTLIGGESGPKARPCNVADVRALAKQSQRAGVLTFVKQLGARPQPERIHCPEYGPQAYTFETLRVRDPHGGEPHEWPEDLRVREVP